MMSPLRLLLVSAALVPTMAMAAQFPNYPWRLIERQCVPVVERLPEATKVGSFYNDRLVAICTAQNYPPTKNHPRLSGCVATVEQQQKGAVRVEFETTDALLHCLGQ